MNKSGIPKPLVRSGWLRVLLYIIGFFILTGIALGVYLLVQQKPSPDLSGMKALLQGDRLLFLTPFLFILTGLLTYAFRCWIDRNSFISLGFHFKGHGKDAIAGGMLAIFIIGTGSLILKLTGHLKWMDIILDPKALFMALGSIVLVAFYEELIFRGYILSNLMDSFPKWLALLISALLFMIFHWSTLGFFPLVNMLVMGLLTGLNYIYTRNLWFSIFFHTGWKLWEGPVLGFYGNEHFQTLLQTELQGDEMITGGSNGLEGSVILTAVSLLSLLALYLIIQQKLNPESQPVPGRI